MNNDTQPLTEDQAIQALEARGIVASREEPEEEEADQHIHGPFNCLLNANHNALRWCLTCGQSWVGTMAGSEDDLRWHVVVEPEEEE